MKTVYSAEIKIFALDRRKEGKGWGEIRRLIRDKFKPDPLPSLRAMQRWDQLDYNELSDIAVHNAKAQIDESININPTRGSELQLRALWESRHGDEQTEYQGWHYFFKSLEYLFGSEKFRKYVEKHLLSSD